MAGGRTNRQVRQPVLALVAHLFLRTVASATKRSACISAVSTDMFDILRPTLAENYNSIWRTHITDSPKYSESSRLFDTGLDGRRVLGNAIEKPGYSDDDGRMVRAVGPVVADHWLNRSILACGAPCGDESTAVAILPSV